MKKFCFSTFKTSFNINKFYLVLIFTYVLQLANLNCQVKSLFVYYQNYEYLSTVKLNDYAGYYGNVKILRYSIPTDVISAIWRLQLVSTESCPATNVYFYLEHSAYPVIAPNNRSFPSNFNQGRLTKNFVTQKVGGKNNNKHEVYLNVSSPNSGYWFSAAFIDSSDQQQQVKPDLLRSNCSFYLTASVNIWQINDTVVMYPNKTIQSSAHDIFRIYKYLSSSYDGPLSFQMDINQTNINRNCNLTTLLRQSAFPDMNSFKVNEDYKLCFYNNSSDDCKLNVDYPLSNTWYFIAITSYCDYTITVNQVSDCSFTAKQMKATPTLDSSANLSTSYSNLTATSEISNLGSTKICSSGSRPIETFRFIGPTYFSVKYYFNSNYNRSNALLVRNNNNKPYFIEFLVDLANNGGTLNFHLVNNLVFDPSYAEYNNASVTNANYNKTGSNKTSSAFTNMLLGNRMKDFNLVDIKVMLHVCLLYNSMSMYKKCPPGYEIVTQSYTNIFSNLQLNVAYPYIGKWYLAIWKECLDSKTNEVVPCPVAYVPYAVIQIASDQCANDYCGEYGTCYIVNSQLNLVSTCKCTGGYAGYGCTDSRDAISSGSYIASVLFLTLSNLIFLLPICLALYRRWYIESLIYFYNMFFSTFYHACDQEFYSFCIFNYDGLQLADFISSYTSFVITILAMSTVVRPWKVFTFFVGLLACVTINLYDRFNYIAFIVFLCIAISVTVLTWVRVCLRKKRLHPNRKILLFYYLPGFILAASGLLIYSFFQTKSNYWYLHSIWHMCMASSILFFLPKKSSNKEDFDTSTNTGENLKDVTTTTSSLSGSSGTGSTKSNENSPSQPSPTILHGNQTEITLLEKENSPIKFE